MIACLQSVSTITKSVPYTRGYNAAIKDKAKNPPYGVTDTNYWVWLAGYNDKLNEMGL